MGSAFFTNEHVQNIPISVKTTYNNRDSSYRRKRRLIEMEELGPHEHVIFERIHANWLRGFEGVGGKLFLTNERLVFIPHGLNFQTEWVQIEIWAMTKIEKSATWGLIPNGITITLDSGHVFKFVVWNRSKIIKEIVQAKRMNNEIM